MSNEKLLVEEDLIGKVAVCGKDIVGVITGKKELEWGESWIGERLDDGGPWSSKKPRIIANSIDEYNNQLLNEFSFDGNSHEEEDDE